MQYANRNYDLRYSKFNARRSRMRTGTEIIRLTRIVGSAQ